MTTVPDATDASDANGPTVGGTDSSTGSSIDSEPFQGGSLRLPLSPTGADRVRPVTIGAVVAAAAVLAVATAGGFRLVLVATLVARPSCSRGAGRVLAGSRTPRATSIVLLVAAPAIMLHLAERRSHVDGRRGRVRHPPVLHGPARPARRAGRGSSSPCSRRSAASSPSPRPPWRSSLGRRAPGSRLRSLSRWPLPPPRWWPTCWSASAGLAPFLGVVALLAAIAGAVSPGCSSTRSEAGRRSGWLPGAGSLSWSWRRVFALQPAMLGIRGQVGAGVGSVLMLGASCTSSPSSPEFPRVEVNAPVVRRRVYLNPGERGQ